MIKLVFLLLLPSCGGRRRTTDAGLAHTNEILRLVTLNLLATAAAVEARAAAMVETAMAGAVVVARYPRRHASVGMIYGVGFDMVRLFAKICVSLAGVGAAV